MWQDGDWREAQPSVKLHSIELIDKFDEIDDNESEYMVKPHDAYDREDQEQVNIINDIIASMHDSNSNAVQVVVMDETSTANIPNIRLPRFIQNFMKILTFTVAAIITALLIRWLIETGVCRSTSRRLQLEMARRKRPTNFESEILSREIVVDEEKRCSPNERTVNRPRWDPVMKAWTFSSNEGTAV
jgi:hypothetical protein